MDKNIKSIINKGLCTGCGTCAGVCANSAILMGISKKGLYIPKINDKDCINCGLCANICPGEYVNFKDLNKFIFNDIPEKFEIGNVLNAYVGYSKENKIRILGQSGGIISSLLIFAIENKIIDGAVVTRLNSKNHLLPETYIATSKDEIVDASKSKYCPVPSNLSINEIRKFKGKLAFVGLPCQIHGLRKLEKIDNNVRQKIFIYLGLFCERTLSFHFQNHILSMINVKKEDVDKFFYRDKDWKGWPGDILIKLKNGDIKHLSNKFRKNLKYFYTPWRCNLCIDKLNQLSDISFGDAWMPEFKNIKEGMSMILTRNLKGEKFLIQAKNKGLIELNKIKEENLLNSQKPIEKMLLFSPYSQISKFFGMGIPNFEGADAKKLSSKSMKRLKLLATYDYFIYRFIDNYFLRISLCFLPFFIYKNLVTLRRRFLINSLN